MENGSWMRALACCILLALIMLISPSTIHAGKLGDFEQETITGPPKTKYTANSGCYAKNEEKGDLGDEIFGDCISGCIASGCLQEFVSGLIKAMYVGGTNSLAQTKPSETATQEVPTPLRSTGEPLIPLLRLDMSYQNVESDVAALDARVELGYGPLGIQYRYTTYREDEPDDTLDVTQFHFLYRMSFMATMGIDVGVGVFTVEGNEENSGFSLTLPIHAHSSKGWGMEFRPALADINDTTIEDYALGFFLSRRYVMFQAGYRWLSANTTSLNGPYAGFSLLF